MFSRSFFQKSFRIFLTAIIFSGWFTPAPASGAAAIWYVDQSAAGANNGSSWINAFTTLQTALLNPSLQAGDQIWVADGVYTPTSGTDRAASFSLKSGVALYGGFQGGEIGMRGRNWVAHPAILSGEIGDPASTMDNSYHVVVGLSLDSNTLLDGFTITAGNADHPGDLVHRSGGGMRSVNSAPHLVHVTFMNNNAYEGGGMYNDSSTPLVEKSAFIENNGGGGMFNLESTVALRRVLFEGNSAFYTYRGGAIVHTGGTLTVDDSIFTGNNALGTLWMGGRGGAIESDGLVTITGSLFTLNVSGDGYSHFGIYPGQYGAFHLTGPGSAVYNSIIWDNSPSSAQASAATLQYDIIEGGFPGEGNLDLDPLLLPGTAIPGPFSPAIDAGSDALLPLTSVSDYAGLPRLVDDPRWGSPGHSVDLGPYEFQYFSHKFYWLPMINRDL